MDSDELIFDVLEQARQLGVPLPDPWTTEPAKIRPVRRGRRRSPASPTDVVWGYRVVVAEDTVAEGPPLPELRGDAVLISPCLMGLQMEVVAGWCATHLVGKPRGMKSAMAAARWLRKISILAAVERCQPEPAPLPQASQPSTSSRANSSILGG